MNLKELSKLYYLKKLIIWNEQQLQELEDRLQSLVQKLSDMPRTPGTKDPIGETIPLIVDMKRQIAEEQKQYNEEEKKIRQYISSIHDEQIRLIFSLRFVDLKSWGQVADEVGGGNTPDSVKKACYRFLKADEKSCPECPDNM